MALTITNEDNMLLMARYPDNYFDLAIVDPPYGINITNECMGGRKTIKPDKNKNYIILNQKMGYIVLFNFKTVKSHGAQKIKIPNYILKELNKYYKALKVYKKINKITNNYFLLQKNGDKLTRNDYTKFFNEIFKNDNKLISTSLIRKIITSDTWNIKEIKELSDKMQHTVQQSLKSYVKI